MLPIHPEKLNCRQAVIAYIATYYHTDFELMLADNWSFQFTPDKHTTVGKGIHVKINDKKSYLKTYHGISLSHQKLPELGILKNNSPKIVTVDTFHIPWDKGYHKFHNLNHVIAQIKYDPKCQKFLCVDPFYNVEATLSEPELLPAIKSIQTVSYKNPIPENIDYKSIVANSIIPDNSSNSFTDMQVFSDCLIKIRDFSFELGGYDNPWYCPLIFRLGIIKKSRLSFSLMLNYIFEKTKDYKFLSVVSMLDEIAYKWETLRKLLLKGIMSNNYHVLFKASELVLVIKKEEEKATENLLQIVK